MKKKWIIGIGTVLAAVLVLMVVFGGNVFFVETDFDASAQYSARDIRHCANLVKWHFFCNFHGAQLENLRFDAEFNQRFSQAEAERIGGRDAIILHSDWTGGLFGANEPGYRYQNWKWIFVRTPLGLWELTGAGYG